MNKINYQKKMEEIIKIECNNKVPTLLMHSCCAPCSSYCIDYLSDYFEITILYYNPNIYPEEEYYLRVNEQKKFIESFPTKHKVKFVEGRYDKEKFYEITKGMENVLEGHERCHKCYELRLREAADYAKKNDFDYFTTTLSISPLKDAQKLHEIGKKLSDEYGIKYLYSDFKKKEGYKKSTEISKEYGMYRQYYCGCVYSKKQRDTEIAQKNANQ